MQCFQHHDKASVGLCKACAKGVCSSCAIDTGRGLACSEKCVVEVNAMKVILDGGKQIYGIGNRWRFPRIDIVFFYFSALIFLGFGLYPVMHNGSPDWFTTLFGVGALVFGIMTHFGIRKRRLNC